MMFVGAGGIMDRERDEVHLEEFESSPDSNAQRALRVARLSLEEGFIQTLATFQTPRFSVPNTVEAL